MEAKEHRGHKQFRVLVPLVDGEVKVAYTTGNRASIMKEVSSIVVSSRKQWTELESVKITELHEIGQKEESFPVRPGRKTKDRWIGFIVCGRIRAAVKALAPAKAAGSCKDTGISKVMGEMKHGPNCKIGSGPELGGSATDVTDFWLNTGEVVKSQAVSRKQAEEELLAGSKHGILPSVILDRFHMMLQKDEKPFALLFGHRRTFGRDTKKTKAVHRLVFSTVVAGPWAMLQEHVLQSQPDGVLCFADLNDETLQQVLEKCDSPKSMVMVKVALPGPGEDLHKRVSFHLVGTEPAEEEVLVHIARKGKDSHVQSFLYLPDKCLGREICSKPGVAVIYTQRR